MCLARTVEATSERSCELGPWRQVTHLPGPRAGAVNTLEVVPRGESDTKAVPRPHGPQPWLPGMGSVHLLLKSVPHPHSSLVPTADAPYIPQSPLERPSGMSRTVLPPPKFLC